MNILLVNDDPVVTKLVSLSTQKTGDRLDVAKSIEEIRDESYDLLILDSSVFSLEFLERLNDKIIYSHSIFVTTRDSNGIELFEKLLYKPFLPTELLFMLHHFAAQVKKEKEELSKEIVFDDFENTFFSEDEIIGGEDEAEQDALERVQKFEKIAEELLHEIAADEASEEEILENIFPVETVSEVKAVLEALSSDDEERNIAIAEENYSFVEADEEISVEELSVEEMSVEEQEEKPVVAEVEVVEEVSDEDESLREIDEELERALRNVSADDLSLDMDDDMLVQLDDISTQELSWDEPQAKTVSGSQNQESIETLRTLLMALENPQLAKSLRGTITINLTFGED